MAINLSAARAGDKVIMRDGSKVVLNEHEGQPRVILQPLKCWQPDGVWSPFYPDCPLDIVGIVYCTKRERNGGEA